MRKPFVWALNALGVALLALASGCSSADAGAAEDLGDVNDSALDNHDPVEVQLEKIGSPKWRPVDFHHFSAPWWDVWTVVQQVLPPPNHVVHPALGLGPGAPHEGPYDHELKDGMDAHGYVDRTTFTAEEFKTGAILMWMTVPSSKWSPKGSSPDFKWGPIIPNSIFPIRVEISYVREGVVDPFAIIFEVPALTQDLDPLFKVKGHSHFPVFGNDSAEFYPGAPAIGSYERRIMMIDAEGEGWKITVPFEVH
jgi:hypothetical protein